MMLKFKRVLAIMLCMTMVLGNTLPSFASSDLTNQEETTSESFDEKEKSEKETAADDSKFGEAEESVEESETSVSDKSEKESDETKASEEESITDETKTSDEEAESDETKSSDEEPESDETKASDEESESEETSIDESESSESETNVTDAETSETSETETEQSEDGDVEENKATVSEATYDDIIIASQSVIVNDELNNDLTILSEGDGIHGLGFEASDFEIPAVKASPAKRFSDNLGTQPLPTKYDPREEYTSSGLPKLPPVRNQGGFGTCWAFSTIGMFETYLRLNGYVDNENDSNLSEAALTYFAQYGLREQEVTKDGSVNIDKPGIEGFDYTYIYDRGELGHLGGNHARGLLLMSSYIGAVIEDSNSKYDKMSSIASNGLDGSYAFNKNGFVLKNGFFLNRENIDMVKEAVKNNGSVGISYFAGRALSSGNDDAYVHKINGEYYYYTNVKASEYVNGKRVSNTNHAILIVGWDDDVPKDYFSYTTGGTTYKPTNNGGWLCRNSWGGKGNSTDSYFWMSYEEPGIDQNMYSVEAMNTGVYEYNYHYDTTTCVQAIGYEVTEKRPQYFANIFKVSDTNQDLEAVNVAFLSANAKFDILIYTSDNAMKSPSNGTLRLTQSCERSAAGIYTIELENKIPLKKGTYFSVVIRAKSTSDGVFYMFCDEKVYEGKYYQVNTAAAGQSFYGYKSSNTYVWDDANASDHPNWSAGADMNESDGEGHGRNFRIKALTNPAPTHTLDKNWFSGAGIAKSAVTKVTIQDGGEINNYSSTWDIDNKGLKGYIVNSTEAVIQIPELHNLETGEDASEIFAEFTKATALVGLPILNTSKATNMSQMFCNFGNAVGSGTTVVIEGLEDMDVSNVTNMRRMLAYANYIQGSTLDLSKWKTSKLESIEEMFRFHGGHIKTINLNGWDTSSLTNMKAAFEDCYNVELINLLTFDTSNVTDFSKCFASDGSLETIIVSSSFVINNGASTGMFFYNCEKLVGGNGTQSADKKVSDVDNWSSVKYAKIDAPGQEGYFTGEYSTYNVTFNMNGHGTQIEKTEVVGGGYIARPTDPTETGYNFLGWFKDSNFNEEWDFATNRVKADTILYAKWAAITYTITYNLKGVSATKPADILKTYNVNATLNAPTNLPSGYTFVAWYEDENLTTQYTGNRDLSVTQGATVTIYAKWKQQVIFNANGHGTAPASKDVEVGSITLPSISAKGYTFAGWYSEAGCINKVGDAGAPYNVTGAVTLYAKWTAKTYTINYNANGGNVNPTSFEKTYDTPYASDLAIPTKTGYSFAGWYTTTGLTTEYVKANDDIYVEGKTNYDIYAKWTANTYTINYNANGGTVSPTSFEKKFGTAYSGTLATPTKTGYTFAGWYRDNDIFNNSYNKSNDDIYTEGTTNYSIYAKWNSNTYNITYNLNKGSWAEGYTAPTSWLYSESGSTALPNTSNVVRNHYNLEGWYKNKDLSGDKINSLNGIAENITLYAKWFTNEAHYTIKFNSNGGSGSMVEQCAFEGEDTILNANEFTKSGYSFSRWKLGDSTYYSNTANIGEVTSDLVLYAEWTKNPTPSPSSSGRKTSGGGGSGGGGGGGGGGIPANNLPATLPNGQPLLAEPITTVTAAGVTETVGADATTGLTSTTVNISFSGATIMNDTSQSRWSADTEGKWHLQLTNASGQIIEPIDTWACLRTNVVDASGQTIVVSDFYFFNGKGEMVTGWLTDLTGKTYFLETAQTSELGKMSRGWKSISGKYFYFNDDGTLMKGGVTPDGYTVDATGVWLT